MRKCCCLVMIVLGIEPGASAELCFEVGEPDRAAGIDLLESPQSPAVRTAIEGRPVLSAPIHQDYYERQGIPFTVTGQGESNGEPAFLLIEHLDGNLALIAVRYRSSDQQAQTRRGRAPGFVEAEPLAGYTALGTGQPRKAVFRLTAPDFSSNETSEDFTVYGVRSLTKVSLLANVDAQLLEVVRNGVPTPEPRVKLQRPMQLVTTVGADATTPGGLEQALASMRELCPLAKALGFSAVESYVKWWFVEPEPGRFDWSYYDAVVAEARRHGLRWFPLLVVGSAYTLPDWYHDSPENVGFVCLEHGKRNNIQSIFAETQTPHVQRFLKAFGEHYGEDDSLLGVRLGPSGNFGESQYPAGGNWGYRGEEEHIHIGWWAGDRYAAARLRAFLRDKYPDIHALNQAWDESYESFEGITPFIPQFAETRRRRKDFVDWYMGEMTDWCERWGRWAREAMPDTAIYQSAGGWGFVESGTDFTDQTKSMAAIRGGIRSTNETDSYAQTFYATRMMTSAARFYGVPFGAEPAGYSTARGVVGRLYNILVNNGQHLFYYQHNLLANDPAIDKWMELAPLLDQRDEPFIEIAALYPDTMAKLDDALFRNLYAFTWNNQIAELRERFDFDFCSERMALDGALARYKVLLLLWNLTVEADALDAVDSWVRNGGTVVVADWRRAPIATVEGDTAVQDRWRAGDTGKGRVLFIPDDRVPAHRIADKIVEQLNAMPSLDPRTKRMLGVETTFEVYSSIFANGTIALLNFDDRQASVRVPGKRTHIAMAPYSILLVP